MRDLYSDDFEFVAADGAAAILPEGARRIAGAAVFVGLIGVMGLWAYQLGTQDAREVPIIKAMVGPTRVQPEEPGGLQAAHQGLEVNSVLASQAAGQGSKATPVKSAQPATAKATAQPEVLKAEDAPQGTLVAATPAALAQRVMQEKGAQPGDAEVAALAMPDEGGLTGDPMAEAIGEDEAVDAAAVVAGPRPMNRPTNLVLARANATADTAVKPKAAVATTTPAAAVSTPAPTPVAATPQAAAVKQVTSVKSGTRMVQLGAYDSEAMAQKAWSRLVAANPDLLSSKGLYVERATSNARVFYRLRATGFDLSEQTRVMCELLRSRGVDCIPVTL